MLKCNACGATYEPIGADGLQYFHACPPLSRVELGAIVGTAKVPYQSGKSLAFYQAKATAAGIPIDQANLLAADDLLAVATYERGNKRDENLVSTHEKDAGTIKAEGAGAVVVAKPAGTVVVVK